MNLIELFILDLISKASANKLIFDFVGDKSNLAIIIDKSSDLDFIFCSSADLNGFIDIFYSNIKLNNNFKILSRRMFKTGEQIIFRHQNKVVMLDLMLEMRFHNFILMDTRIYFELKDAGYDVVNIVKFIKNRTKFKDAWPNVPPEFYSFQVRSIRWLDKLSYYLHKFMVIVKSMFAIKTGVFVVVLGPDGSGKSTIINKVAHSLCIDRAIIPVFTFHWRPQFLKTKSVIKIVTDPHSKPPRSRITSLVKLIYLIVVFNLGYLIKIRRLLHRDGIVIFDRYYHDILVDSQRYRLQAPLWLTRLISKTIPSPDLWILLDAPPEVLQSRKQEVSFEETKRQRNEYLYLIKHLHNGVVVDASQLPDLVAESATKHILDFLETQNTN